MDMRLTQEFSNKIGHSKVAMIQADDAHATNCHLPPEVFNIPITSSSHAPSAIPAGGWTQVRGDPQLRVGTARTGLKTCVRGDEQGS
jgi:hypothetical protein